MGERWEGQRKESSDLEERAAMVLGLTEWKGQSLKVYSG